MADVETLAWGFSLIEGPSVDSEDNLYFSDVHRGGVYRRSPDGEITTSIPKRRGVGGTALHADGGLVVSGRNIQHVKDGAIRVLFEAPGGVTGFNDLTIDAVGRGLVGSLRTDPFDEAAPQRPASSTASTSTAQ